MTDFFNWLAYDILWGTPLIVLMIFTGLYFTIRSGFFQVAHFKYILKRTLGTVFSSKKRKTNFRRRCRERFSFPL